MSKVPISFIAIDSFIKYITNTPSEELPQGDYHFFADYIRAWVESGHGVRACYGDLQTFLIAVSALIQYWCRDPDMINYLPEDSDGVMDQSRQVKREVYDIFPGSGEIVHHIILDPTFFLACRYNELYGKRHHQ